MRKSALWADRQAIRHTGGRKRTLLLHSAAETMDRDTKQTDTILEPPEHRALIATAQAKDGIEALLPRRSSPVR
jgi:hypothetical protein